MKCIEAQKLVKPYLEKELSDKQLEQFLDHVENCKECYDELEIYFFIYETLGGAALEEPEAEEYDFKEKLKKDIKSSRRYLRVRKTYRLFRCAVIVLAELLLIGAVITGIELRGEMGSQGTTIYRWMYEREHSVKPTPKKIAEAERQLETQTEGSKEPRKETQTETPKAVLENAQERTEKESLRKSQEGAARESQENAQEGTAKESQKNAQEETEKEKQGKIPEGNSPGNLEEEPEIPFGTVPEERIEK